MSIAEKPSEITLPALNQGWPNILAFLCWQFPRIASDIWQQRIVAGKVHWFGGEAITLHSPFLPSRRLCYYREVAAEPIVPFTHQILWQNEHILIACKPHFLPVTPGGEYVNECLLQRLRRDTGIDDIVPVHRLDRETAGLVLFSIHPQSRPLYYQLFATGQIEKSYQAVAHLPEYLQQQDLPFTKQIANRLEKSQPRFLMQQVSGEINARSSLSLVARRQQLGLFDLQPHTGKTHQLRLHMQALGAPILNDKYYPQLLAKTAPDFQQPLQLLAKTLRFIDPVTQQVLALVSPRALAAWPTE